MCTLCRELRHVNDNIHSRNFRCRSGNSRPSPEDCAHHALNLESTFSLTGRIHADAQPPGAGVVDDASGAAAGGASAGVLEVVSGEPPAAVSEGLVAVVAWLVGPAGEDPPPRAAVSPAASSAAVLGSEALAGSASEVPAAEGTALAPAKPAAGRSGRRTST